MSVGWSRGCILRVGLSRDRGLDSRARLGAFGLPCGQSATATESERAKETPPLGQAVHLRRNRLKDLRPQESSSAGWQSADWVHGQSA